MAIIKFDPIDSLGQRGTVLLLEMARFDACDLTGEFEQERFSCYAKLRSLQAEAEQLGLSWTDIYSQAVAEVEIYESDRESELSEET